MKKTAKPTDVVVQVQDPGSDDFLDILIHFGRAGASVVRMALNDDSIVCEYPFPVDEDAVLFAAYEARRRGAVRTRVTVGPNALRDVVDGANAEGLTGDAAAQAIVDELERFQ